MPSFLLKPVTKRCFGFAERMRIFIENDGCIVFGRYFVDKQIVISTRQM